MLPVITFDYSNSRLHEIQSVKPADAAYAEVRAIIYDVVHSTEHFPATRTNVIHARL
jgi:hypothetical protein